MNDMVECGWLSTLRQGQAPIAWPQRLPSSSKDRRMQSRLCQIRHEAFVQWMESRSPMLWKMMCCCRLNDAAGLFACN